MEHSGVNTAILIVVVAAQLHTSLKTQNHIPNMSELYSV